MQYVDEALGPGSEWKPAVRRWLRAAAESGQSEAEGWPEVPPPVDTRELLTLTPACFRAQIEGIDAERRFPGQRGVGQSPEEKMAVFTSKATAFQLF